MSKYVKVKGYITIYYPFFSICFVLGGSRWFYIDSPQGGCLFSSACPRFTLKDWMLRSSPICQRCPWGGRQGLGQLGLHAIYHDMTWYDMIKYDMTWCPLIWHDMTWYNIMSCDMTWYDMIKHDMTWCPLIWHDMTWYNIMSCDMTWYDMIWHDKTWYDMMPIDMTWYDMI